MSKEEEMKKEIEVLKKVIEEQNKPAAMPPGENVEAMWIGRVVVNSIMCDVYLSDWKIDSGALGYILPNANKIFLTRYQDPQTMCITLIHEMTHKFIIERQLPTLLSEMSNVYQMSEVICRALDTPIFNDILCSEFNRQMFNRILNGEFHKETEKQMTLPKAMVKKE